MRKEESPTIFICECNSREHQIIIHHDTDDNVVYCHIHLQKSGFWRRLLVGIKYIFGYKCRFGHWDEFIWTVEHAPQLRKLSDSLLEAEQKSKLKISGI